MNNQFFKYSVTSGFFIGGLGLISLGLGKPRHGLYIGIIATSLGSLTLLQ